MENEWWQSSETGEPFTHCVRCRLPLLELDSMWLVNREFQGGECMLEYAVCQGCRDAVTGRMSEESRQAVRAFLEEKIDWEARLADFMMAVEPAERLDFCVSCRAAREKLDGFAISAQFDEGGEMVVGALPLLICRVCVDRMMEGLSDQSRAVWRDFVREHFDGPPDGASFPGIC